MMHWIISANREMYDHESSFEKYSYVDWKQTANLEVDDIVYIYSTQPIGRVQYKTRVVKIDMSFDEIIGQKLSKSATTHRAYWSGPKEHTLPRTWEYNGYQLIHLSLEDQIAIFKKKTRI